MTNPEEPSAATRLCASCGMCCNGVMFYSMRLQPSDHARTLTALGLKLKRKNGELHFPQPCPAHRNGGCAIYPHRPERCRAFQCRQLLAMTAGHVTETEAVEKIRQAGVLVSRVKTLLLEVGENRENKALATRFESALTPPLDPSRKAAEVRARLQFAMQELEDLLARDFRVEAAQKMEGCGPSHPIS